MIMETLVCFDNSDIGNKKKGELANLIVREKLFKMIWGRIKRVGAQTEILSEKQPSLSMGSIVLCDILQSFNSTGYSASRQKNL